MINRLAVRADQVNFSGEDFCSFKRLQTSFSKCLGERDVQLGNCTKSEIACFKNLALQGRIMCMFLVLEKLRSRCAAMSLQSADCDIDRVGTRSRHQPDNKPRWLDASLQKVRKCIGH